jgi:hypothetical protein
MFRSLIEDIRSVVEGQNWVDQISATDGRHGKRNGKKARSGATYSKKRASKVLRKETRRKIKTGDLETLRDRAYKKG